MNPYDQRNAFAAAALQGILANANYTGQEITEETAEVLARECFVMADAMLAQSVEGMAEEMAAELTREVTRDFMESYNAERNRPT